MTDVDHDVVLRDLMIRKALAEHCVQLLREDPDMIDDPRQPAALEYYQEQLENIRRKIDDRKLELGIKPPPIVIGLQPGRLAAIAK